MHPSIRIVVCLTFCLPLGQPGFAKGGRGHGGGKKQLDSAGHSRHKTGVVKKQSFSPVRRGSTIDDYQVPQGRQTVERRYVHASSDRVSKSQSTSVTTRTLADYDPSHHRHSENVRFQNAHRKLDHRLQTAERLRQNAIRNGNQNLLYTADQMEQKANDHYDRELAKLGYTAVGPDGELPVDTPVDVLPDDGLPSVARSDAIDQLWQLSPRDRYQPLQSQRYRHQVELAHRFREIAERNGNEGQIRMAEEMEARARSQYRTLKTSDSQWSGDPWREE